jgi:transcriptional regulator with GAF, ATPase, and Fis domain
VAATNRNLRTLVEEGKFRDDLFFRLNIIPIDLPPLRERKGDLPLLINHFLQKFAASMGKDVRALSTEAKSFLETYRFPGNVREVENVIERAVVLAEGDLIQIDDLELGYARNHDPHPSPVENTIPVTLDELKEAKRQIREKALEDVEKAFVISALERNHGNITRAAEETGMLRPNFQALLKKLGISGRDYAGE